MASVVFLYRSTKDSACLTARLLFRYDKKDFILTSKTKLDVTKTYWSKKYCIESLIFLFKGLELDHRL